MILRNQERALHAGRAMALYGAVETVLAGSRLIVSTLVPP